jgi:hypothetical protein
LILVGNHHKRCLDKRRGVRTMKDNRLKVEIAQLSLSDPQRIPLAL